MIDSPEFGGSKSNGVRALSTSSNHHLQRRARPAHATHPMAEAETPSQGGRRASTRRGGKRGSSTLISTSIDVYHNPEQNPPPMVQNPPPPQPQGDFQYVFQSQQPNPEVASGMQMAIDPTVGEESAEGVSAKPAKNDRRHGCSKCGKMFNRPSSLRIHFSTHTGERRKCTQFLPLQPASEFVAKRTRAPFRAAEGRSMFHPT